MGIKGTKRENFDVSPEQEADIDCLQDLIKAPTRKDAILTAVRLALHVAAECKQGNKFYIGSEGELRRMLMIGIETPNLQRWKYLVEHSHPWKKQLFIKGRKLTAAAVWSAILVNKLSYEQAADNWDLPVDAIAEIMTYCEENEKFLEMEAGEEERLLNEKGLSIESKPVHR